MTAIITHRSSELKVKQAYAGYLFILPSFVLYLTFVLAPVAGSAMISDAMRQPCR